MSALYPIVSKFVKKQGVLYPVTHSFVKKTIEVPGGDIPEPGDSDFSITIDSGADCSFILPTSGRLNNTYNSYAWIVDWGDGTISEYSGTGSTTSGITHAYPQANTQYKIKIMPQDAEEQGWLRAFGFYSVTSGSNAASNKEKVLIVDGQLTEQSIRRKETDNYVCGWWFYNCPNLIMGASFQLPQDIASVGSNFCSSMFHKCTSLTMNSNFQLPRDITSVSSYFCYSMFSGCTSLTMNDVYQLPQSITSVGTYFCGYTFYECTSLTMGANFQLPRDITSVSSYFCYNMFSGCTSLTMNDVYQLPQSITSVGTYFCDYTFYECTSLTTGVIRFFGNLVLPESELSKSRVYSATFNRCSSLTETLSSIPQLQMIPNSDRNTFFGCPAALIAPLHTYWK